MRRTVNILKKVLASILLAIFALSAAVPKVYADLPDVISYQGRLLNTNGVPLADATASIIFELYTASSGGSCVWSNSSATCASATARTVTLTDGLFSETLGDTGASYAAMGDSLFTDNQSLYLQVTVNAELLSPRKRLTSAPYAQNAENLDSLNSDSDGSTVAAIPALSSVGALIVTGAPAGSGISQGSVYINPASADAATGETIFGVARGGSAIIRVDDDAVELSQGITFSGVTTDIITGTNENLTIAPNGSGDLVLATDSGTALIFDSSSDSTDVDITTATNENLIIEPNGTGDLTVNIDSDTYLDVSSGGSSIFRVLSTERVDVTAQMYMNSTFTYDFIGLTGDDLGFLQENGSIEFGFDGTAVLNLTSVSGSTVTITSETNDSIQFSPAGTGDLVLTTDSGTALIFDSSSDSTDVDITSATDENIIIGPNGAGDLIFTTDSGTALIFDSSSDSSDVDITTASNESVIVGANGTGDLIVNIDSNSSLILDSDGASTAMLTTPGNDSLYISASGTGSVIVQGDSDTIFTIADSKATHTTARALSTAAETSWYSQTDITGSASTGQTTSVVQYYMNYTAVGSSSPTIVAVDGEFGASGSAALDYGIGVDGLAAITGASVVLDVALIGTRGLAHVSAAATVPEMIGLRGDGYASAGTITNMIGVKGGDFTFATATITNGYGGYFLNDDAGTTRYGVYASASGGTTNYGIKSDALLTTGASYAAYLTQNIVADATTTPTGQALVIDVNEAANNDEVILIRSDADGTPDAEFRFENDGDAFADGAFTGAGADYAEFFETTDESLDDYHIVCRDTANDLGVKKCAAGDRNIVGVISTSPAFIGNNLPGADGDLFDDPGYRLVGLMGQIETYVTAADGAIAVGDELTTSSITAGYAGKANGSGYIIGRALESLSAGQGTIKVLVYPTWYAGNVLADDGDTTVVLTDAAFDSLAATATMPAVASRSLSFIGSAWSGTSAVDRGFRMNTTITDADNYRLSIARESGEEIAAFTEEGDLLLAGRLYPSDRGLTQEDAYIYYDSTGPGYMRTNAAGWGVGSYDFAETFASSDALVPGDVVVFGSSPESVARSTGETYDDTIAGVVSTRPGFLAGDLGTGRYPIALSGRVPTRVSAENGPVAIGDPLTTSSVPGVAMKATQAGPILGYAMASLESGQGTIVAFIRASYYDGGAVAEAPGSDSSLSGLSGIASLNVGGTLNMGGNRIVSIGSLEGIGSAWQIEEDGTLITRGGVIEEIRGHGGEIATTHGVVNPDRTVELAGTVALQNGRATVQFSAFDPSFSSIISPTAPLRVIVTPSGITGQLYITERSAQGFTIIDPSGASGVAVDWLAIAIHKDGDVGIAPELPPDNLPSGNEGTENGEQEEEPGTPVVETIHELSPTEDATEDPEAEIEGADLPSGVPVPDETASPTDIPAETPPSEEAP